VNKSTANSDRFPFLSVVFLQSRLSWSVQTRWLGILGYFLATLVTKYFFHLNIPFENIWYLLGMMLVLNTGYYLILKISTDISLGTEILLLHIHIIIDLLILTVLLHFSGGIDNPIFLFYLFHVVLSSIVFSRTAAVAYATLVVFLFSFLTYLEYAGIIDHYSLYETSLHQSHLYIYLLLAVFIITVYVTAYICTTLVHIYRESKRKIDQLNEQLIELDKDRTNFFRFTSHELKSPIIAIKSSIDGVVSNYRSKIDERAMNLLQRASARAGQMLDIIKELLELSRSRLSVEKEEQSLERIDILDILNQIIVQESVHAEEKNINLNSSLEQNIAVFKGKKEDFEKIFRNLINNAIRYTDNGGSVNVSAEYLDNQLKFRVQDTGIGIAEQDLPKIFQEFYRSENAKKVINFGTGLGLSLVKQLVEKYDGIIEIQSELQKGTEFIVDIPIAIDSSQ